MSDGMDDDTLSAWVDGELDAAARDQVQAWLQTHPDDMARVQAWATEIGRASCRERV